MSLMRVIFLCAILIFGTLETIQYVRRKLLHQKKRVVKRISRERAEEAYRLAYLKLDDWIDSHRFYNETDPEYRELVEQLLKALQRTFRYKTMNQRDQDEVDRLEEILTPE